MLSRDEHWIRIHLLTFLYRWLGEKALALSHWQLVPDQMAIGPRPDQSPD